MTREPEGGNFNTVHLGGAGAHRWVGKIPRSTAAWGHRTFGDPRFDMFVVDSIGPSPDGDPPFALTAGQIFEIIRSALLREMAGLPYTNEDIPSPMSVTTDVDQCKQQLTYEEAKAAIYETADLCGLREDEDLEQALPRIRQLRVATKCWDECRALDGIR